MQSILPTRTVVVVVALLAVVFLITGLGSVLDANGWNAIATFSAVAVALYFGLREATAANHRRRTREIIASALVAPYIVQAKRIVGTALRKIDASIDEGTPMPWDVLQRTTREVKEMLSDLQSFRMDLPEEIAFALSLMEAASATVVASAQEIADINGGLELIPHPMPNDLKALVDKLRTLLKYMHEDLRLAHALTEPVMQDYRLKLMRVRATLEMERY